MTEIDTSSFKFSLPPDWKIENLSSPASLVGPKQEYVMVSAVKISGAGSVPDRAPLNKELKENLKKAMLHAVSNPQLQTIGQLSETTTERSEDYLVLKAESTDKTSYFYQFGIVSQSSAVLVTVEGLREHMENADVVEKATKTIQWH